MLSRVSWILYLCYTGLARFQTLASSHLEQSHPMRDGAIHIENDLIQLKRALLHTIHPKWSSCPWNVHRQYHPQLCAYSGRQTGRPSVRLSACCVLSTYCLRYWWEKRSDQTNRAMWSVLPRTGRRRRAAASRIHLKYESISWHLRFYTYMCFGPSLLNDLLAATESCNR